VAYIRLIGLILGIHLLAVISPGPDFVMVLKNALQHNRKIAIYTSLGISMGIAVHILYSLAGVAYLLQQNHLLFSFVKTAGALYIIYMGVKTIAGKWKKLEIQSDKNTKPMGAHKAIQIGFVTNALNPKASLFFLSIFSIVIPPETPAYVLAIISASVILVTFLWFAFVSFVFTNNRIRKHYEKYELYITRFFGFVLILLGISIFYDL